jgi:hypothetical protein
MLLLLVYPKALGSFSANQLVAPDHQPNFISPQFEVIISFN